MRYAATPLTDPQRSSALVHAIDWLQGVVLGSVANIIAVIAVAAIGFLMLTGRLDLRRGAVVVLGCFIIFGARVIALAISPAATVISLSPDEADPPAPPSAAPTPTPAHQPYDPYAGASLPGN